MNVTDKRPQKFYMAMRQTCVHVWVGKMAV